MGSMSITIEQASNIGLQYIAAHGQDEWLRCTFEDGALRFPDDLAAKVLALDPNASPVPVSVTQVQMRSYLITAGLLESVIAALQADTSTQGKINLATFEYASAIERQHPLIASMGAALGMTSEQIDQAFRDAALF